MKRKVKAPPNAIIIIELNPIKGSNIHNVKNTVQNEILDPLI
jgi:hypothetical protein